MSRAALVQTFMSGQPVHWHGSPGGEALAFFLFFRLYTRWASVPVTVWS